MTATKTRHLHPVPDPEPAPAAVEERLPATTLVHLPDRLTGQRNAARRAALSPDVIEQKNAAITEALAALAKPGANRAAALRRLADGMYRLGHMDSAAGARPDALAELALASITRIDEWRDGNEPA